jgi:predicted secreted protein
LLPDGRRPDTQALAVGDRVLMVLSAPDSASNAPNIPANLNQTYSASIVERLVVGDKVVTH